MKSIICFWSFLFVMGTANAQVVDDNFADGDFTTNPSWSGSVSEFKINASDQLQLDFTNATLAPAYLSTTFIAESLNNKEWRFDVRLDFSPSASNKVVYYLASSEANLLDYESGASTQQGYYLEIGEGGSDDAVSLFYRNGNSSTLVVRGGDGQFAAAFENTFRVRRDENANWEIAVAPVGSEDFTPIATAQENSINETTNLGMLCFFTASRSSNFYFDNIYFGPFLEDTTPPEVLAVTVLNSQELSIRFSEALESSTATNTGNYNLIPGNSTPLTANLSTDTVSLSFASAFQNGTSYTLEIDQCAGCSRKYYAAF